MNKKKKQRNKGNKRNTKKIKKGLVIRKQEIETAHNLDLKASMEEARKIDEFEDKRKNISKRKTAYNMELKPDSLLLTARIYIDIGYTEKLEKGYLYCWQENGAIWLAYFVKGNIRSKKLKYKGDLDKGNNKLDVGQFTWFSYISHSATIWDSDDDPVYYACSYVSIIELRKLGSE